LQTKESHRQLRPAKSVRTSHSPIDEIKNGWSFRRAPAIPSIIQADLTHTLCHSGNPLPYPLFVHVWVKPGGSLAEATPQRRNAAAATQRSCSNAATQLQQRNAATQQRSNATQLQQRSNNYRQQFSAPNHPNSGRG